MTKPKQLTHAGFQHCELAWAKSAEPTKCEVDRAHFSEGKLAARIHSFCVEIRVPQVPSQAIALPMDIRLHRSSSHRGISERPTALSSREMKRPAGAYSARQREGKPASGSSRWLLLLLLQENEQTPRANACCQPPQKTLHRLLPRDPPDQPLTSHQRRIPPIEACRPELPASDWSAPSSAGTLLLPLLLAAGSEQAACKRAAHFSFPHPVPSSANCCQS